MFSRFSLGTKFTLALLLIFFIGTIVGVTGVVECALLPGRKSDYDHRAGDARHGNIGA